MSRLVVDSCVAVKWLVIESGSIAAGLVLRKCLFEGTELLAPDSVDAEVGSALWRRAQRGLMTAEETRRAFARFRELQITKIPSARLLDDALLLALEHGRSFYDCLFLALSLQQNCPFLTADERLVNAVGSIFPQIELLAADA